MLFLITYDLKGSKKDHAPFYEKIKSLGAWMHYLEATWIVSPTTSMTASQIFERLRPHIDEEEDYVFVVKLAPDHQGLLPKEAWGWLNERST